MKFEIEKGAAQAILNYLQTKPYREVFQLVPLLVGLKPIEGKEHETSAARAQEESREEPAQQEYEVKPHGESIPE